MIIWAMSSTKFQVHKEISPIVLAVISCLVPILQHAEVIFFNCFPASHWCIFMMIAIAICGLEFQLKGMVIWLLIWIFFSHCIYFYAVKELNKSLVENSAITIGRLAWVCPELVSPHMEHFMQAWCIALSM